MASRRISSARLCCWPHQTAAISLARSSTSTAACSWCDQTQDFMKPKVDVSQLFNGIMSHTLDHVAEKHGEAATHHLFFELYNHTFSFLEREFGLEAVQALWESIADRRLCALEELMRTKGFEGMGEYWRQTLGQEGADFEMEVT